MVQDAEQGEPMMTIRTYQACILVSHGTHAPTTPTRVGSFWPRFVNRLRERRAALRFGFSNRVTGVTGNRGIA